MDGNRLLEKRVDRELKRCQINIEDIFVIQKFSKRKEIYVTIHTKKVKKDMIELILDVISDVATNPFELDEKIVDKLYTPYPMVWARGEKRQKKVKQRLTC